MIHCYIDESGNTGGNLFDPAQPHFYLGAVIAPFDFDEKYPTIMQGIAKSCGQNYFHANAIGMEKLEPHLAALQSLVKHQKIRFYIARIEKSHLVLAKFIDLFLDPYDNRAAPWHVYNTVEMRFLMMFNLNNIVSEDARRLLWAALMEANESAAFEKLRESIRLVQAALVSCPERRTIEIVGQALEWASANLESIRFFSKSKRYRVPHFPNVAAFPEMLAAFDRVADHAGQSVVEIKHDRQCEVESVLRDWHEMFTNASDEPIDIFGEARTLRVVPDSTFSVVNSKDSAGIQLIDLVLWLERQRVEKNYVSDAAKAFLDRVERNAEFFDMSLAQTQKRCLEINTQIMAAPLRVADEARGRAWLAEIEARRQTAIRQHAVLKSSNG